jgi:pilus assembly protein CpaE
MSQLILATSSSELHDTFARAVGSDSVTALRKLPSAVELASQVSATGMPELVVLDAQADASEALDLAAATRAQFPALPVILISLDPAGLALPALRAGVQDIVSPRAGTAEVRDLLQRVAAMPRPVGAANAGTATGEAADGKAPGRLISVVSPKGGVGKTTVSTNIAVGLARLAPHSTVLVDLDLQFGDVASGLNLDPEYYLQSAVQAQASRDTMMLKSHLTLHETGLYVICAPETPAAADAVTPQQVAHLLQTLRSEFRYVVVDTAPGLSDFTLAALDHTTDPVLLTSMDVPGLRGLRKELDTLRELNIAQENRHIVLNFADPRAGLSVADIEATIGAGVDVMLPRSKVVPASVNLGVPLLQSGTRDPMTGQLQRLVARLAPVSPAKKTSAKLRGFEQRTARPAPRRAASGWFRRPALAVR